MPWLLSSSTAGRRFKWESVTAALAAVAAKTQTRYDTSSLYTNIVGLWGMKAPAGGGTTTTAATAGTPGSFTGPTPANLTALKALGPLGNTTAWTVGQNVVLGDASTAYWGGAAWVAGVAPAPTAAITATVAGTTTASATITFGGGPAPGAGTITLTANAGVAIAGLTPVAITANMTAAQAATAVAAELNGKKDGGSTVTLAATAAGSVVTVTEAGGANIATLTAVVA